jgi:XTP/dITP diphosphohydrolase
MARLVLATRNQGKITELRRILLDGGLDVELLGTQAFQDLPDIPETETTFAANALIKARAVAAHTTLPAAADDSGLCVDALNGMPGIFSARWSGRHGDDEANLDLLLGQLGDVPDERRTARFVCAAAVCLPDGTERVVEGQLAGRLIRQRRGSNGFGYDPIFVPNGDHRTTAELTSAQKDEISHRGQAFRALIPVLRQLLAETRGDR